MLYLLYSTSIAYTAGTLAATKGLHTVNTRLTAFALWLFSSALYAHPHAWIDVHSTLLMSDTGQITAIEQRWLFDEMYTSAILIGMEEESPEQDRLVKEFAAEVMENLRPYAYFTRVMADTEQIEFMPATHYSSELNNGLLQLSFTAALEKPLDPQHQQVSYSVYDPTYYIHMEHLADQPPGLLPSHQNNCQLIVEPANPSPELIAKAFALDQSAKPDENLGHLFAEKVRVRCKPS